MSVAHVGVHPGHLKKIIYKLEENQPFLQNIFCVIQVLSCLVVINEKGEPGSETTWDG